MNLLDELREYAEGEEPRSGGDQAQIDGAVESAALRPGFPLRTVATAAAAVGSAALIYALWPSSPTAPQTAAPSSAVAGSAEPEVVIEQTPPPRSDRIVAPGPELEPKPEPEAESEQASEELDDAKTSAPTRAKQVPTLNALLERAQAQRAAREHSQARATYRLAIRSYPNDNAAKRAWVALGDLELNRLDNAKAALKSYDRYIASGADPVLIQEAGYGRIRALRRLGRGEKESTAISEFMSQHPRSPYQAALERRQRELDTPLADPTL